MAIHYNGSTLVNDYNMPVQSSDSRLSPTLSTIVSGSKELFNSAIHGVSAVDNSIRANIMAGSELGQQGSKSYNFDSLFSSPSPSSGYSVAAGFDGGASMGYASAEDALERPWSSLASLYGMDTETAYQEALASTAHQREVSDLKAAGLNPVLSATGGNGSAVFGGTAAPVLSAGSGGSSGYSPGSAKDGSTISDKVKSLNWRSASSSLGNAIGSAFAGNISGAVSSTISGVIKLFS